MRSLYQLGLIIIALLAVASPAQAARYAIVEGGTVINVIEYDTAPATPPPGFPDDCIAISTDNASPGWGYDNGDFVKPASPAAPTPPPPTLMQQAEQALMFCAITITSASTPALSGTYPCDATTDTKIASVVIAINTLGTFPGGASTYPMKDVSGAWHTMTTSEYTEISGVEANYVGQLVLISDGNPMNATSLPSNSVTIP